LDNSNISATAAIAGSKLADGAITNAKLDTASGGIGAAWLTWTPTFANLSGGTLNYAKYIQIGKTVHYRLKYTLAGAGMGTAPTFTAPTSLHSDYGASTPLAGNIVYYDTSVPRTYKGYPIWASSTTIGMLVEVITGGNLVYAVGVDSGTADDLGKHRRSIHNRNIRSSLNGDQPP
jgi:hypothetical protein